MPHMFQLNNNGNTELEGKAGTFLMARSFSSTTSWEVLIQLEIGVNPSAKPKQEAEKTFHSINMHSRPSQRAYVIGAAINKTH